MKTLQWIVAALMTGLLGCAAAEAAPARIEGVIAGACQDACVVTTARGQQERISIEASTRVSVRTPAAHSILDSGAYVGVTATAQADGTLLASEVRLLPLLWILLHAVCGATLYGIIRKLNFVLRLGVALRKRRKLRLLQRILGDAVGHALEMAGNCVQHLLEP